MFNGWMMLAGNEIINTARTEAYAYAAGVPWFTPCETCTDLNIALGDDTYRSVMVDEPPWYDPDDPDTLNFFGFYPLDVQGTDDSVRVANVTEGLGDGGVIGPLRQATRAIVVSGMILALDECAAAAGMSWLRWACLGSNCHEDPECVGDKLCFLSCCPPICHDDPDFPNHCLDDYLRTFHKAVVTEGPTITAKHAMSGDGVAWEVQFTITCGVPWTYGTEQVVFQGSDFGHFDTVGPHTCPDDAMPSISDPHCPPPPRAPTVPAIQIACYNPPDQWDRYTFPIPMQYIRTWQDSVPRIEIRTLAGDGVRNVRLRWYADPLSREKIADLNLCDFCGEFLITYIPPLSTFVIDGVNEVIRVHTTTAKGKPIIKNASTLVMDSDGGPFSWPLITCGYAYLLVVDVGHGNAKNPDWLSISMYPRGI